MKKYAVIWVKAEKTYYFDEYNNDNWNCALFNAYAGCYNMNDMTIVKDTETNQIIKICEKIYGE